MDKLNPGVADGKKVVIVGSASGPQGVGTGGVTPYTTTKGTTGGIAATMIDCWIEATSGTDKVAFIDIVDGTPNVVEDVSYPMIPNKLYRFPIKSGSKIDVIAPTGGTGGNFRWHPVQ